MTIPLPRFRLDITKKKKIIKSWVVNITFGKKNGRTIRKKTILAANRFRNLEVHNNFRSWRNTHYFILYFLCMRRESP